MKKEIRTFALGMLLSTSILGVVYYQYDKQQPLTQSQVEAYLKKHHEIALSNAQYHALQEKANKANKQAKQGTPNITTVHIYHLVIEKGDVPAKFAKKLETAKIIADADTLTSYLETHQLTRAIRPGTYEIRSDMSYEQIAAILTHGKR
ncbi:endolytic transglycosylase MltG [Anoxybacteroides amylolyticum]|uniref:YceG-like family protein n=1 Tax=Anoxybacteroides amylolyticum TaxID=294699 RepID=A0A160F3Z3_9BACL|nr:endolytic transglycosylase MltG [Anoxybacillus amylolyticus]ANB61107.1 yceG-like family protein [Anoxybacillus amylolyticus]